MAKITVQYTLDEKHEIQSSELLTIARDDNTPIDFEKTEELSKWMDNTVMQYLASVSNIQYAVVKTVKNYVPHYHAIHLPSGKIFTADRMAWLLTYDLRRLETGDFWSPLVYISKKDSQGFSKIGSTKYEGKRQKQLKTRFAHTIDCWYHDPVIYEITLHNFFRYIGRDFRGEWFKLTDEDINFVKSLKSLTDVAKALWAFAPTGKQTNYWKRGNPDKYLPDYLK